MTRKTNSSPQTPRLFRNAQQDIFENSYEEELEIQRTQKVECLGMTIPNEEERRKYFWRSFAKSSIGKRAHSMKEGNSLFHGLTPSHRRWVYGVPPTYRSCAAGWMD
jgi:hypothetical protein